jgi:inhibitor of KinA
MEKGYEIFSLSDQSITFSLGNEVNAEINRKLVSMKNWLAENRSVGICDIIISYSSLTIHYDYFEMQRANPHRNISEFLSAELVAAYQQASAEILNIRHWEIPVCYGDPFGPDLTDVARQKNLSVDSVINIHSSVKYTVFMIGFLPGFPYLAETDFRIHVSRKQTPAPVEAGSVGLAGKQTGIYPLKSPGGWQIIGRTPIELFDASLDPPVKFQIGDTISFFQIDESQFVKLSKTRQWA